MAGGLIGALGGAGLGLVKNNQDKAEYNRQKELAAQTAQYSPWTGMQADMPKNKPNAFGSLLQGALGGAQMGMPGGMFGGAAAPAPAAGPQAAGIVSKAPTLFDAQKSPWMIS